MKAATPVPQARSTRDADHGVSRQADWRRVARELAGLNVITAEAQRRRLSNDFHW